MKQRKLFILIWDMGIGGAQKRVRDILLDIEHSYPQWEIHLLVKHQDKTGFLPDIIGQTNAHVYFFTTLDKPSRPIPSIFWIAYLYNKISPDVCLTFLDYLSLIMIATKHLFFWHKARLVLNEIANTTLYLTMHRNILWKILIRLLYRYADDIIVPSQACRRDLHLNFNVPFKKLNVIPNWTLFKPVQPYLKQYYHCIYVGRLDEEKNPMEVINLIDALRFKKPNIRCCILGEGKQEAFIKSHIQMRGLNQNIKLFGFQTNVIRFLKNSRILLLPSFNEGLPNVVLEAGMCQIPTISFKFPGVREVIINGKTGFVTSSPTEMVALVYTLLQNNMLRRALGEASQRLMQQRFSYKNQQRFIKTLLFDS